MEIKEKELFLKAKEYAFLLLKFRLRSEQELFSRLKKKGFPENIIIQTLDFLKDKDFIDDKLFAKSWIESRLKRPFGFRRIKEELRLKGLDKAVIDDKIKEARQDYDEEDCVKRIAKDKFERIKRRDPVKTKRQLYAFLIRRGFSPEIVAETVNQLCKHIS